MTPADRARLVGLYRLELKQRRGTGRPRETSNEEQLERNARRYLNALDSRRPRLPRNASDAQRAAHVEATRRYQSDISRRGGYRAGETLRQHHEAGGGFGLPNDSEMRATMTRRMNVRLPVQTRYHRGAEPGPLTRNYTEQSLTPAERVNRVGTASRRRSISPGMAPPLPGEAGHEQYVARVRAGNRRRRNPFGF